MKKTLVALAVAAVATSASALTVYENEGTKVDFDGSIRLRLDKGDSKESGETKKTEKHSNLHNDGSRFGVKMQHNIADDFYALGRVEFRFDDEATGTDQFGDLYAKRAYVGFGSKQYGEITFGRQVLIGDDINQAGFDNAYGKFDGTLTAVSNSAVRYDYKGIEGLQIGLDYRFAENRNSENDVKANKKLVENNVVTGKAKSGYGVGAIYDFKIVDNQSATVAAGYTRDNYATESNFRAYKDAYAFGAKYTIDALTLGFDYAGANLRNAHMAKDGKVSLKAQGRSTVNWFRVGAKYDVTPAVAVYTNYGYGVADNKISGKSDDKYTYHGYTLGTQYQVHKNVFAYLEGSVNRVETKNNGVKMGKTTEKDIGIGLRVNW